jgi:hypothetical protein
MTIKDPISGRQYEQSITGIKQWAAKEVPHGVPLLYSLTGFAVIIIILYTMLATRAFIFGKSTPAWIHAGILCIGIFWGFGGWQHGCEVKAKIDAQDQERSKDFSA